METGWRAFTKHLSRLQGERSSYPGVKRHSYKLEGGRSWKERLAAIIYIIAGTNFSIIIVEPVCSAHAPPGTVGYGYY